MLLTEKVYPFKNIFTIFLKYSVIVITDQKEPFWSAILTNRLVLRVNRTLVDQICMWTPLKFFCYGQCFLS